MQKVIISAIISLTVTIVSLSIFAIGIPYTIANVQDISSKPNKQLIHYQNSIAEPDTIGQLTLIKS